VSFLTILSYVAVGLVVLVLIAGLYNLMRGGSPNLSQKLMRARIILQLIAIIIVLAILYFSTRSGAPPLPPG
jgi:H+/Cl- antiporter ClcA